MIRYVLFTALIVAIGLVCYDLGQRGARAVERMQVQRVQNGLEVLGMRWARVEADGLRLELHGHAPDTYARELALESARATASLATVTDYATANLAPPERREPIRIEFLRDARGITLTGQTANRQMRDTVTRALAEAGPGLEIRDLTGIQAEEPGPGWRKALAVASAAAAALGDAYVVLEPSRVSVIGEVAEQDTRDALIARLEALAGSTVALEMDIEIPPRVIAPFTFAAWKEPAGAVELEACAARDAAEAEAILATVSAAGAGRHLIPCPVGLGGPEGDWPGAIAAALAALEAIPAGRIDIEYRHVRLVGAPPTPPSRFEEAAAAFQAAMPAGFEAEARLRSQDVATLTSIGRERYWLRLVRGPEGVMLSGEVPDATSRTTIVTYAAALFGAEQVRDGLSEAGRAPPQAWQSSAMRLLDILQTVTAGEAELAGHNARVHARVVDPTEAARVHELLLLALPDYAVGSRVSVDVPAAVAAIPLPAQACAVQLRRIVQDSPLDFAPGSAVITDETKPVLETLAAAFTRCSTERIAIGGHTDSQGSEDLNQRLSLARAKAVLNGLVNRGVALARLEARGYGESLPIADNETEAGRAHNRRIEFRAAGE